MFTFFWMKKLIILFLFFNIPSNSQDFSNVDALVKNYPRFSKVEDLANKIKKDFSTDTEKVRAAFFWLTKNIRYNLKQYYNPKPRRYKIEYASEEEKNQKLLALKYQLVEDMFKNKTGVCEEYAQAFKLICNLLDIESEVIKGYTRSDVNKIDKVSKTVNHAWNAVKVNNKWLLLDATWAAGYNDGGKWVRRFDPYYFDVPKDKIFKTHYPEETLWVLRFGRMSIQEFYKQPVYKSTFLNTETELISPKNGIIRTDPSRDILIKFKNFDTGSQVIYNFTGIKGTQKAVISTVDNLSTITIKNPRKNTNLFLFINGNDALHFKVRMR